MLKIIRNNLEIPFSSFNFPSGEVGFKISVKDHFVAYTAKTGMFAPASHQTIIARLNSSNDIMELFMAVDALRNIDRTPINLFLMKVPYAQQDRVCVAGESFSLVVFARMIASLNFNKVTVIDPHSSAVETAFQALQINYKVITQLDIINKWPDFINVLTSSVVVAPDIGSVKKIAEICKFANHTSFIRADKLRDLNTGEIIETVVYADDLKGADVIIPDDICLGGKTFTELAKILKTKNCGKVRLFVTHGVFSNGINSLMSDSSIDEIWTTNSFWVDLIPSDRLKILNLEDKFKVNIIL